MAERARAIGFDTGAAVTRSLLGWGVVAGPFYLLVGTVHALLRPGFDLARHPLSVLMLTDTGWIQRANLVLTGLMVIAAAVGLGRAALGWRRARVVTALVAVFGVGMIGSGIFAPDPIAGFPPGAEQTASISGILHLLLGAVGFLALGAAAIVFAGWLRERGSRRGGALSLIAGVVVIAGFVGGGALSAFPVGTLSLWIAVVAGFAWLLGASLYAYRVVPHPDAARR